MTHATATTATTAAQRVSTEITAPGHLLLTSHETEALAGATEEQWAALAREWDHLTPDRHMADGGTYRLRRYSSFDLDSRSGTLTQRPHAPYVQSAAINYLNGGTERHFDPCTPSFCVNPALRDLLINLGSALTDAHGNARWDIKLHPYRITAHAHTVGHPAPEGRHRDGVTYIGAMMIGRHHVEGGTSAVFSNDGRELTTVTLEHRGQLLLSDDRTTLHSVTPLVPAPGHLFGHRDVLVIAYTAVEAQR